MKQAVLLAAGRGTRLGHLTARRSKAMLPVVGQPLVGCVLERLSEVGLHRFAIVGGPDDQELVHYCASQRPEFRISYVVQPERRGMAHALACAAPLIEGPFLLCACDNLVASDFVARMVFLMEESDADGVLALLHMSPERLQHSAAVELTAGGRVRRIVEKPPPGSTDSDAGSIALYAFGRRLLDYLDVPKSPRGELELQSAIQALINAGGDVRGLFAPDRQTVTRPADLLALNLHYLGQGIGAEVQASLPPDVRVKPPVRIEEAVQVGTGCVIGPRVYIEAGCRVGAGAVLRETIVLRGGVVPDGAQIADAVWADSCLVSLTS